MKPSYKSQLRNMIKDLLKGKPSIEHVFYYDNTYHIIHDEEIIEISHDEASAFLKHGAAKFYNLLEDKRQMDRVTAKWVGKIPIHILPEGLPECKVVNITCAFPVTGFLDFYKKRSGNRKDYVEPITGFRIVKDE